MRQDSKILRALIRESLHILRESAEDNIKQKVFGSGSSRTDLYNQAVEKWAENEAGNFKFVFKDEGGKLGVTVSAVGGADERAASALQGAADEAVKSLTPADWSGLPAAGYTHVIPSGVSYDTGEMSFD